MKITSLIILAFLSLNLYGQTSNDTTGIKLFNRGLEYYNNGNLDSTLILWTKIVEDKIGVRYDLYGNAFFNIPTIYWQMKNYENAKEWYKKILVSDLRDNDETGSLMEPHTNYCNKNKIIDSYFLSLQNEKQFKRNRKGKRASTCAGNRDEYTTLYVVRKGAS